jgi:hypothetical protein
MYNHEQRIQHVRRILWDVNADAEEALRVLDGRGEESGIPDRNTLYARLLASYHWYTILQLVPREQLTALLADDVLSRLWPPELRKRYEYARRMVCNTPLSASG